MDVSLFKIDELMFLNVLTFLPPFSVLTRSTTRRDHSEPNNSISISTETIGIAAICVINACGSCYEDFRVRKSRRKKRRNLLYHI